MRLSRVEVDGIATAARTTCPPGSRVYLFGSRVDDDRRGGDIDLLVETPQPLAEQQVVSLRNRLTALLYRLIGERRIDVLVTPPAPPGSTDPVTESARAHAIELVRT